MAAAKLSGLIGELEGAGVEVTRSEVVAAERIASGKIVFLEKGNATAGLQHIVERHGAEFAKAGISENKIPAFLMQALKDGKVVGYQGRGVTRPIYGVSFEGKPLRVAITIGNNGYVVGANIK